MTKREAFEHELAKCYEVEIFVVRQPAVDVPTDTWKLGETADKTPYPYVVLRYGLDMPKPIPDLIVDSAGIHATLSFSNTPVKTFVPWDAIFGIKGDGVRPRQSAQLRAV